MLPLHDHLCSLGRKTQFPVWGTRAVTCLRRGGSLGGGRRWNGQDTRMEQAGFPSFFVASRLSGRGNRIGPVCLCVLSIWVLGTYVVHHCNGTVLRCAPLTCVSLSVWHHDIMWRHRLMSVGQKDYEILIFDTGCVWLLRCFYSGQRYLQWP